MNTSTRGPLRGKDLPFVMHLERVCRLIEMGQRFIVEFNPCSDIGGDVKTGIRLTIRDGGEVCMQDATGAGFMLFDLSLANYKRVWRCWQNGVPTEAQRRSLKWG